MLVTEARRSWPQRLAMTSVFIANGLAFGAWIGNLPRLREDAGLDNASLGMILLCGSIGSLLAMQIVGRLAGRIGTARTSWISTAALAVALPLPALLPAWPLLLAFGLLLGAVLGSLDVAMIAHAAQVERGWGVAIMSSLHAGWSLGELAGAAAAGLLADAGASLFVALAISGLASAVCGLAALLLPDAAPCSSEQTGFAWPGRAMLGLCAISALSFGIEGGAADWAGVYLQTELGASAALSSMGLAAFAAAMVVCRLCGDVVVRQLGPMRVIRWGSVLTGLGLLRAIVVRLKAVFLFTTMAGTTGLWPAVLADTDAAVPVTLNACVCSNTGSRTWQRIPDGQPRPVRSPHGWRHLCGVGRCPN